MHFTEPKVFLIGETRAVEEGLQDYLKHIGVPDWTTDAPSDAEKIIEIMGRGCYKSWKPGLNPNVTRVREGNKSYISNIIKVGHGSVVEHSSVNFVFTDVSRVFTHELVRHRAGTAMSQESLRFVRLTDLGFWKSPIVINENPEAMEIMVNTVEMLEKAQLQLAEVLKLDEGDFSRKKKLTSAMRRIAPIGLSTVIGWTCNMRSLRHLLEMRTDPHSEEEIRLVFGRVGEIVCERYPNLFGDYTVEMVDGMPWYKTADRKI